MTNRLLALTFDCADAAELGGFWAQALGQELDPGAGKAFASSGKIQRRETAARYADGTLGVRTASRPPTSATGPIAAVASAPARADVARVRAWLLDHLAAVTGVPASDIRATEPFDICGLDSRGAVALAAELGGWLGRPVSPGDIYGHPTVDALARYVSGPADVAVPVSGAAPLAKEVAIVGIGCRFPGADGPAGYWSLLSTGAEAIREIPPERWNVKDFFQAGGPAPGRMYTRRGGFIDEADLFDAEFFGLSDAEARYLDPQQRLLLEVAWAAMEDAGVPPADLAGSATGVYVGLTTGDYAQLMTAAGVGAGPYAATGNVACMADNRVSYTFDLRGPSLTVDTACSSSLVAIHQACAAIRAGEIDAALAGGVNLMLSPVTTVALCQSGALSPDGRYWGRNLRDTVLFLPAVERLAAEGYRLFLEMSPNPTLVVPVQQALDEQGDDGRAIGSLVRGRETARRSWRRSVLCTLTAPPLTWAR